MPRFPQRAHPDEPFAAISAPKGENSARSHPAHLPRLQEVEEGGNPLRRVIRGLEFEENLPAEGERRREMSRRKELYFQIHMPHPFA